jgi:hypothetical protein
MEDDMRFVAIPTDVVRAYQAGGLDANGQVPERKISDGGVTVCRHCLKLIPKGAEMLVLAHRPFPVPQPYAEVGPIFLCAAPCAAGGGEAVPEMLASSEYIVRGYGPDDRIVYGTGGVVATEAIPARARELLADGRVAYVHVRSARNNCFQCRIDR